MKYASSRNNKKHWHVEKFLKNISLLPSILFPASCLCCQKQTGTQYLCSFCCEHLPTHTRLVCPECQRRGETPEGTTCMRCFSDTPLSGVFAALSYQDSVVKKTIHNFKYHSISSLANPLANRLIGRIRSSELPLPDLIIPVPLHRWRENWRGFNQSELIAREVADSLIPNISLSVRTDILKRIRPTKPQAKHPTREKRLSNLKDAFALAAARDEIRGRSIWLVDDVATTNTTLTECAHILKQAGAKEVWGVVLAR